MSSGSRSPTMTGQTTPVEDDGNGALEKLPDALAVSPGLGPDDANQQMVDVEKTDSPTVQEFEVKFTSDDDPNSPKSMSTARKWMIVVIVSATSLCVACTSSLYIQTYAQIMEEFHCSEEVATLGLSLFVAGLGLSPMMLAPLSEFYGRKPIYVFSLAAFVVLIIPCAVATNIQTLIAVRFFNGFAGSAFLSVAGGTVGDLFSKHKLLAPMTFYTITPFLGPEMGPVIGGFINYYVNWRWSFWVLLIWSGLQWALITFLVPETYHPVILRNVAKKKRKETGDERWYAPIEKMDKGVLETVAKSIYRPFTLLIFEPMCFNLCIYCALLLGIVYLFFGAFGLVFSINHDFNLWQIGLSFLGIATGMIFTVCFNSFWAKNYRRLLTNHEKKTGAPGSEPEYRLPAAIVGAPLITVSLLWFGWTTYASVHWIVPIIGSVFFGTGIIFVFSGIFAFLVDAYPTYAASALAANSFARSMFAAAFPLFGNIMYENLGFQWATFVLAMISLLMAPFPYIFYRWGKWFRTRSKYAGIR